MSTRWVTAVLCPVLGTLLANAMWLSPWPAVCKIRTSLQIGELNSSPYIAMVFNCTGSMVYGILRFDLYLFWANVFGLVLGLFYSIVCLTALRISAKHDEDSQTILFDADTIYFMNENLLLFSFLFWSLVGMVSVVLLSFYSLPFSIIIALFGWFNVVFSILYYASPLSTIARVIVNRDSSALYFPLILINLTNGFSWFVYGLFGVGDIHVTLPNGVGAGLASIQLILFFIFRKKTDKPSEIDSVLDDYSTMS